MNPINPKLRLYVGGLRHLGTYTRLAYVHAPFFEIKIFHERP